MNPMHEYLLALQLIQLSQEGDIAVNTYSYKDKKLVSTGHTLYEAVNFILDSGLNPLMLFGGIHFDPENFYLLTKEIFETKMAHQIIPLMIERVTPERINDVPTRKLDDLVKSLIEKDMNDELSFLFKQGYRVEQGNDIKAIECFAALQGCTYFFELLTDYQPEFDLERKYKDSSIFNKLLLTEILKEDLDSMIDSSKSPAMNTYIYLNNLLKIKSFHKLSETLEDKQNNKVKVKI
jgi:hypothetical protein